MMNPKRIVPLFLLLAAGLTASCDEIGKALSEKPNIKSLDLFDEAGEEIKGRPINIGEVVTAEVSVSGEETGLKYKWETVPANTGSFDLTDEKIVTWTAPNTPSDLISLKVTVTNKSDEKDSEQKSFAVLDPTAAPSIVFVSPEDGSFVPSTEGEITIEVEAEFTGGQVDTVWFFVADSLIKTDLSPPFRATWEDIGQFSGPTELTVRARNATSPSIGENSIVVSIENAVVIGGN